MTTVLPSKPSALIKLALSDLKLCETDKAYHIDMAYWHKPATRGIPFITRKTVCDVCMAGAVMAQTLRIDKALEIQPFQCEDSDTTMKLFAIDHFRTGALYSGVRSMCGVEDFEKLPKHMYNKSVPGYDKDAGAFHNTMNGFATELKAVGL